MYRSGSTWQYNIASRLVEQHRGGYRLGFFTPANFIEKGLPQRVVQTDQNCLILKVHDRDKCFASLLADGCARALYSYRDLRDVAYSLMHKLNSDGLGEGDLQRKGGSTTYEDLPPNAPPPGVEGELLRPNRRRSTPTDLVAILLRHRPARRGFFSTQRTKCSAPTPLPLVRPIQEESRPPRQAPTSALFATLADGDGTFANVSSLPIGEFTYPKWGGTCHVEVFPLEPIQNPGTQLMGVIGNPLNNLLSHARTKQQQPATDVSTYEPDITDVRAVLPCALLILFPSTRPHDVSACAETRWLAHNFDDFLSGHTLVDSDSLRFQGTYPQCGQCYENRDPNEQGPEPPAFQHPSHGNILHCPPCRNAGDKSELQLVEACM